uniref:Uncharacterized protein n=1 Tax=Lepeophtheirus salmonis TaxID=72036 RepID=A0A0K2V092_LEPSM
MNCRIYYCEKDDISKYLQLNCIIWNLSI